MLHLDVCSLYRSLCYSWKCLHFRSLSCSPKCLHCTHKCTLQGPQLHLHLCTVDYRSLCCSWACLQRHALNLDVFTSQGPKLHLDVFTEACAAPGRVYTTEAWAATGSVCMDSGQQEPLLLLDVGPELPLDVFEQLLAMSTWKGPERHLDLCRQQKPVLLLDVSREACAASRRVYTTEAWAATGRVWTAGALLLLDVYKLSRPCAWTYLDYRTSAAPELCLHYRFLWCIWPCLHHRGVHWTCLDIRSFCWSKRVYTQRGRLLQQDVPRHQ